jgi:hypothetical protein
MCYNVHCTHVCMYISYLKKNISQMFQNYSELYLAVSPPTLQAALREGCSGDSDL